MLQGGACQTSANWAKGRQIFRCTFKQIYNRYSDILHEPFFYQQESSMRP
jgi:hypothetical protein